ncbi:hypothetical protein QFC19_008772 [Naganishia cerealis]|uniref:Uncharacterized protein n=1 Tax=Naganishia cerealis TaxID=610337 RepID=A0ACC2UZY6_9TREE|nr:hypothetical protein QFC19_008772 [Naganishia cerealis]
MKSSCGHISSEALEWFAKVIADDLPDDIPQTVDYETAKELYRIVQRYQVQVNHAWVSKLMIAHVKADPVDCLGLAFETSSNVQSFAHVHSFEEGSPFKAMRHVPSAAMAMLPPVDEDQYGFLGMIVGGFLRHVPIDMALAKAAIRQLYTTGDLLLPPDRKLLEFISSSSLNERDSVLSRTTFTTYSPDGSNNRTVTLAPYVVLAHVIEKVHEGDNLAAIVKDNDGRATMTLRTSNVKLQGISRGSTPGSSNRRSATIRRNPITLASSALNLVPVGMNSINNRTPNSPRRNR